MSVEYSTRLLAFFITVGVVQTMLDVIALSAWRSFVRSRGWSAWWYRVPILLGILMFFAFPLAVYFRQIEPYPSLLSKTLHRSLSVWYMPKIAVVAGLIGFWLMRWIDRRFSILTVHLLEKFYNVCSTQMKRFVGLCTKILRSSNLVIVPIHTPPQHEIPLSRRAFLERAVKYTGYGIAAAPVAALSTEALYTLYDFEVHRIDIPISNLPRQFDGFTIAQLSDLHAGSFFSSKPMQEARRITESLKPDMLVITGDWVNWQADELPIILPDIHAMCLQSEQKKLAPFGVWGCLGNHDHYVGGAAHQNLLNAVRASGVGLLVNQNTSITVDGGSLQLAAIDNVGLRQQYGNLDKALEGLSAKHPTILMAHDPTFWDKKVHGKTSTLTTGEELRIDLTLSGHTHGGQMGVRFLGMEFSPAALMYRQCAGLYKSEHNTAQCIYVNRGIGTTGIPIRIGIPPEITLLTLRKAS